MEATIVYILCRYVNVLIHIEAARLVGRLYSEKLYMYSGI